MRKIDYPLTPRSTASLLPGQYWSIPIGDGRFGCGRVIQLSEKDGRMDRRMFLGAVLTWLGHTAPTFDAIAGAKSYKQGRLHIRMFDYMASPILGLRPLGLDGIEPNLFVDAHHATQLLLGTVVLRRPTREEATQLPVLSTWGMSVPTLLAEGLASEVDAG